MKTTLDAHRLLRGTPGAKGFRAELQVNAETDQELKAARRILRTALQDGMRNWHKLVKRDELFEKLPGSVAASGNMSPKFRTQGSYAYDTVNEPAYISQQVDLDDGMFLPVSFVSSNGRSRPSVAAKGYFEVAERILKPVCDKHGWKLNPGKPKATCIRVEISDQAHIDIPLYSIPDEDFGRLTESLAKTMDGEIDLSEMTREVYRSLPQDKIMLANRDGSWTSSDPRKLEDWWDDAVVTFTDQLTVICRYLKAWRDHTWERGGLPSIAIMACVVKILDELDVEISSNRDDVALLLIAERMPSVLGDRIPNPVIEIGAKDLDDGWTADQRRDYQEKARQLAAHIKAAICDTMHRSICINQFRMAFGPRVPENQMLIAHVGAEAEVLQYPKEAVAAPIVLERRSG